VVGAVVVGSGVVGAGALTVKTTPIVAGEPAPPAAVPVMVLVYVAGPRPAGFIVTVIVLGVEEAVPLVGDTESHAAPVESA